MAVCPRASRRPRGELKRRPTLGAPVHLRAGRTILGVYPSCNASPRYIPQQLRQGICRLGLELDAMVEVLTVAFVASGEVQLPGLRELLAAEHHRPQTERRALARRSSTRCQPSNPRCKVKGTL